MFGRVLPRFNNDSIDMEINCLEDGLWCMHGKFRNHSISEYPSIKFTNLNWELMFLAQKSHGDTYRSFCLWLTSVSIAWLDCPQNSGVGPSPSLKLLPQKVEHASAFGCHPLCFAHDVFGIEYVTWWDQVVVRSSEVFSVVRSSCCDQNMNRSFHR